MSEVLAAVGAARHRHQHSWALFACSAAHSLGALRPVAPSVPERARPSCAWAPLSPSRLLAMRCATGLQVTLKTPEGDKVVECDGDTYILDAAEEAGG